MVRPRKTDSISKIKGSPANSSGPLSRIPSEVSDSALISAKLVQRIHRSLLMCHLLESAIARYKRPGRKRVHRGAGALVVGSTIGLHGSDAVVTIGDTLLPHLTHETPLAEILKHLHLPVPSKRANARQIQLALSAASNSQGHGSVTLVLCTRRDYFESAIQMVEQAVDEKLPLVLLLQCEESCTVRSSAPIIPVEAHDAIAIYRVTQEAIWRARRGTGPTIVAAVESLHASATDHFESEALVHLREYMQQHQAWDEAATIRLRQRLEAELEAAFAASPVSS